VVAHEDLIKEAEKYCNLLKRNPPLAMKIIKAYILEERRTLLHKYHMMHAMYLSPQMTSEDFRDCRAAAKEKRAPQFKGR
jgi:enoyl-CoA hydratase/carnithine racemase